MTAFEAIGIRRRFGSRVALDDFSFSVEPGECVGLLGFNGSGKSTALRILSGLLAPDAGATRRPPESTLALVEEDPPTYPAAWSVDDVLAYFAAWFPRPPGLGLDDDARRAIERLLPRAGRRRRAHGLSGGERRRVDLARAFLVGADTLVLDEPTKALDLTMRPAVWSLVRRHVGSGGSAILSSHDVEEILACATRVVVLARGRIVHRGRVADLSAPALRVHVRADPGLIRRLRGVPGLGRLRVESDASLILPAPGPGSDRVVAEALRAAGAGAFTIEPSSLARYNLVRLMRGEHPLAP